MAGYSAGSGTGNDYATLKYSQSVGIHQISNEVPEKFRLEQNYPNPFNPVTKIKFSILSSAEGGVKRQTSNVKLLVYDISGKEIFNIINENLTSGSYEVNFDATTLTSGVYFYRLVTDEFIETKKMILTK